MPASDALHKPVRTSLSNMPNPSISVRQFSNISRVPAQTAVLFVGRKHRGHGQIPAADWLERLVAKAFGQYSLADVKSPRISFGPVNRYPGGLLERPRLVCLFY